jgi:Protein of unknown function (DUF4239)
MNNEFLDAGLLLIVLLGSSALGLVVRPLLSEAHRSRETTEFVRLVVTMLMTFVALVLGLLTSSAKASFDQVGNELKGLSVMLIQLDRSLREWGSEAEPARELLRDYTAAVIASTWTQEPKPPGDNYPAHVTPAVPGSFGSPVVGDMLSRVEADIRRLEPQNPMQRRLEGTCIAQFERLMQVRWRLIEDTGSSISTPFYMILVFWLVVVFASFGLSAPRNLLSYATIVLGALSIASALFVIVDLDTPFEGIFKVSSGPMRDALAQLSQ